MSRNGAFYRPARASVPRGERHHGLHRNLDRKARRGNLRWKPKQTSAFDYGLRIRDQEPQVRPPMAIAGPGAATIFVSGTASITSGNTAHGRSSRRQTEQTLDNIAAHDRRDLPGWRRTRHARRLASRSTSGPARRRGPSGLRQRLGRLHTICNRRRLPARVSWRSKALPLRLA